MKFALLIAALIAIVVFSAPVVFASTYSGKTLEEALKELQARGLNVVYSSDLVRPEMMVRVEPPVGSLREILKRILAPYGLTAEDGPLNTLLVVYDSPSSRKDRDNDPFSTARSSSAFIVVPFVNINVIAQSSDNQYVTNLTASDFLVKENGKLQTIVDFQNYSLDLAPENDALTVLFLLDCSQSMNKATMLQGVRRLDLIKDAAAELLQFFHQHDRFMAMGFSSRTWTIAEPTEDFESIRAGIAAQQTFFERTALYDATLAALKNLQESYGRKIIILCSDGEDNASKATMKELLVSLGSSAVTVFSIAGTPSDPFAKNGAENLQKITEASGGSSYFYSTPEEVQNIMVNAGRAIRGQYSIGYYPTNDNVRGWRKLEVQCRHPGVKLRYRKNYLF